MDHPRLRDKDHVVSLVIANADLLDVLNLFLVATGLPRHGFKEPQRKVVRKQHPAGQDRSRRPAGPVLVDVVGPSLG